MTAATGRRTGWRTASRWAAPVLLGALVLAAWEAFVVQRGIKPYLLPSPSAIWEQAVLARPLVLDAMLATGRNVVVGLVLGTLLAVALALVAARSPLLDGVVSPAAAAAGVMPIVALAPALNTMFGTTSTTPRQIIVAVVVFAPVFVTTLKGLRQVQPVHVDLLRAYAATPWQLARTVTIPGALPHLFTGIRIASSVAVISAVVAEYFGGLQDGLGSRITSAASNSAYPRAWAFVLGAVVLGLTFYLLTLLLERSVHRGRVPS